MVVHPILSLQLLVRKNKSAESRVPPGYYSGRIGNERRYDTHPPTNSPQRACKEWMKALSSTKSACDDFSHRTASERAALCYRIRSRALLSVFSNILPLFFKGKVEELWDYTGAFEVIPWFTSTFGRCVFWKWHGELERATVD